MTTSGTPAQAAVEQRLQRLNSLGGITDAVVQNAEWLYMLHAETRNSLSIEGHFATEDELEDILAGSHSAPEILNYFRTAQSIYDLALQRRREQASVIPDKALIRHIHSELFRGLHGPRGRFRLEGVRIQGAAVRPPTTDVEQYIEAMLKIVEAELVDADTAGAFKAMARFHTLFESVHPFSDGNGRVGRIVLNYTAVGLGMAPIIIKGLEKDDRDAYYAALKAADHGFHQGFPAPTIEALVSALAAGDTTRLEDLLLRGAESSLDRALVAAVEVTRSPLVDLSTLAGQFGVKEATLRKWVERDQLVAVRRGRKLMSHSDLQFQHEAVSSGAPTDALPQPKGYQAYQPRLFVEMGAPQSNNGTFYVSWQVINVGSGTASNVRIFFPGLTTDHLDRPIVPGTWEPRPGIIYDDKPAFNQLLKPPVHVIAEFEDHAGHIYRQYGEVRQDWAPSGAFLTYRVTELGTPYLVRGRIVKY